MLIQLYTSPDRKKERETAKREENKRKREALEG
jgi:hypothetical protein